MSGALARSIVTARRMAWCLWALVFGCASVAMWGRGTREAYVWQRQFDEEVAGAMQAFAPQLDGLCVLAAEVAWRRGKPEIVRVPLDYRRLAALEKPIGLALRIGDFSGVYARDDAAGQALVALAREILERASAAQLAVAELQIDHDCAESKLVGYGRWLEALRPLAAEKKTRLVFTALPAWLQHAEFARLARAAEGFVLQVHSLARPTGPEAPFTLCDPERARAWVKQASAADVPFRVALPTYGYELGFDPTGKFIGLAAEGPAPEWPSTVRRRVVQADAVAMAALARELAESRPPRCTGVIWFRLPVPRDRHNWSAAAFSAVLRGEVPLRRIEAVVEWTAPGLAEIGVVNRGETTERMPASVRLKWTQDVRVLAADAIGGFRLEIRGGEAQGIVRAADATADAVLAPGRTARIAWLRFAHEVSLEVSLAAAP